MISQNKNQTGPSLGTITSKSVKSKNLTFKKPSKKQKEIYQDTIAKVTHGHCLARTWRGSQCELKHLEGSDFCLSHGQKLPHGRYDVFLREDERLQYAIHAAKFSKANASRWYSRTQMWGEAERLCENNAEEMTNAQFSSALRNVNTYLSKNPAQRKKHRLQMVFQFFQISCF